MTGGKTRGGVCVCLFLQDKAEIKMVAYIVEETGMEVRSLIVTLI